MNKIYYELLSHDLQNRYNEIEEDLILSGFDLGYYYDKYKDTDGEENCKAVIAAIAGDKAFLTYNKEDVKEIKNLLYVDSISNFKMSLEEELDFFAYSLDYLLKKSGIEKYDDFMIANCLSYYLELRNTPCSIALAEHEGNKVFCNLVHTDNKKMKVLLRNRAVITYPYDAFMNRDFIESMFIKAVNGGDLSDR